jgi:hypothetical protein
VRRLLIVPAILLIMSAGLIARTSPAQAHALGTTIAASYVNWGCSAGSDTVYDPFLGIFVTVADTDAGPAEYGEYVQDIGGGHYNGRDFTFLYSCPVTLVVAHRGYAHTILGAGTASGVGVVGGDGQFHTTAHISILGSLDGMYFEGFSWNQYMVEDDFGNISQNGQITSVVGSFTGLRGTGVLLEDSSTDSHNLDRFFLGFG